MAATRKSTTISPKTEEPRIFLLTGTEGSRKLSEARRLQEQFADPDFADFDSETLDGASATAERVLSAATMVPMGNGKRVVLIRDTQQMDDAEQKRLAAGLERIPESGTIILHTGIPITEDGKTKRSSVIGTELTNALKKIAFATTLDFGMPKADNLREWILRKAQETGKTLAPDALSIFAQLPADDVQRIESEIAKAAAYAGDAPVITGGDVEAILSRGSDEVIFKLCDAIGMRRTAEAMGHISTLFKSGGRPDSIAPRALVMVARQLRLIAQFRWLGEKSYIGKRATGPVPGEVLAQLPADGAANILTNPRMSWMMDKYIQQARNFTSAELTERMEKILHADLTLKGFHQGGDSPQVVMQRLIAEICL